ncbi:ribosomal protein L33 [Hymenobacter sp. 9A]|nr:ribosomal protein L33 [Hymenobacter caeli]
MHQPAGRVSALALAGPGAPVLRQPPGWQVYKKAKGAWFFAVSPKGRTFAILKPKTTPVEMAKKGNRVQVIMECTEHKNSGLPGTSRYITTKNRKNTPERIELKKFNPIMRKMTVHKEIK